MRNTTLLYVEDDLQAREHYAKAFEHLFKKVIIAEDAERAYVLYQTEQPDMLLVDIELPGESGLSLISRIRKEDKETIVIILSAFSQREQLLQAVELGLTKYLIKPVASRELLTALTESISIIEEEEAPVSLCSDILWFRSQYKLEVNEEEILLSVHENRLLSLLHGNKNTIFSLADIAIYVWEGEEEPSLQAIKNLLNRLRKKVPKELFCNHYGVGYQLCG